eukprot:1159014-Pelagomonas_calceolata.AAC.18
MNEMHTNRHHASLSFCVKVLSQGIHGSSHIAMDAVGIERLLDQGISVPESLSQAVPIWVFPYGTNSSAHHQSHPDAASVRSFLRQPGRLDPSKIPPQHKDIHLVNLIRP